MGGPLRIKIAEINAYLDIYGPFSYDDKLLFFNGINTLDQIWIDDWYTNQENRRKEAETRNRIRK